MSALCPRDLAVLIPLDELDTVAELVTATRQELLVSITSTTTSGGVA